MQLSTSQTRVLTLVLAQHYYSEDWCIRNLIPEPTRRALVRKGAVRFCADTHTWSVAASARTQLPVPPPRP